MMTIIQNDRQSNMIVQTSENFAHSNREYCLKFIRLNLTHALEISLANSRSLTRANLHLIIFHMVNELKCYFASTSSTTT